MNALMRIQVRVINEASGPLKQVQRDLGGVNGAQGKLQQLVRGNYLEKYGKNLQWTGRQLEYNFTLPLVLAGAAATKFAFDNERAMTQLKKVYGQAGGVAGDLANKELKQLEKAFVALSNIFGVHQADVINIAADWASAGASGIALARNTRTTLEAMIIGDLDAATATGALVAIQQQYSLSSRELHDVLADLNVVENQTAITMGGLIAGYQRAAGAARTAGVDHQHLAAHIAAISPAAGTAEQAGNSLKTIYSRLLVPTAAANEVMKAIGINTKDASWENANGAKRIELMSKAFSEQDSVMQANISTQIASRWNISKFDVLMRDIALSTDKATRAQSNYGKALDAQKDQAKANAQYQREIGLFLASSPQAFKILTTQMQNALASAVVPLIPALLGLMSQINKVVQAFTNMDPATQKMIIAGLALLALLGPVLRYAGAFIILASKLKGAMILLFDVFKVIGGIAVWLVGNMITLASTIGGAFIGVFEMLWAALVTFSSGVMALLGPVFTALATAMTGLGSAIAGAFAGLVGIIATTMMGVLTFVGSMLMGGWGAISFGIATIQTTLTATLTAIWGAFVAAYELIWGALVTIATTASALLPMIQQVATGAMYLVWLAFTGQWALLVRTLPVVWELVTTLITTIWTFMGQALVFLTTAVTTAIGFIWTALPAVVQTVATAMVAILGLAWEAVVGLWEVLPVVAAAVGQAIALAFSSPWTILVVAIAAAAIYFRQEIGAMISWVMNNWRAVPRMFYDSLTDLEKNLSGFPKAVLNVFLAVVRIVKAAALAVYDWLSYINPFAHHSPSLVEQVTAGVELIARKYASLSNIGQNFRRAISDLKAFKDATAEAVNANKRNDRAEQRKNVIAGAPNAGPAFDALAASVDRLYVDLARVGAQYAAQEAVVARWKSRLDAANAALEIQNNKLDILRKRADSAKAALDKAQTTLDGYANAPIKGMEAMGDAIFSNEMAQKRLQLQMLEWEKVHGPLDDIDNKLSAIAGDMETLRGTAQELRLAGAGSDITGPINAQVDALAAQAQALKDQAAPMYAMKDALDELDKEGQRLGLIQSLTFDPLTRQIEKMVNTTKEMSFSQIVSGIKAARAEVDRLTPVWEAANAAQEKQAVIVEALTASRDLLKNSYDAEQAKLDQLGAAYDGIEQQIRDMEAAMSDFAAMGEEALKKAKDAADAGKDALPTGDFADVGGSGAIGRESGDLQKLVDDWTKEAKGSFGNFDIFAPLKEMWGKAWDWIDERTPDRVKEILGNIDAAFDKDGTGGVMRYIFGGPSDSIANGLASAKQSIDEFGTGIMDGPFGKAISSIGGMFSSIWKHIGPGVKAIWGTISDFLGNMGSMLSTEFGKWGPTVGKLVEAVRQWFNIMVKWISFSLAVIVTVWKAVWPILQHVLKPILDGIVGFVKGALEFLRGTINLVLDLINGDWGKLWEDLKTMAAGAWDMIYAVFSAAIRVVIGVVRGFVQAVVGFFQWLWDVLVGHSIVPDMVNAIIEVFGWLIPAVQMVFKAIAWFVSNILVPAFLFIVAVAKVVWNGIVAVITWAWNNVIKPIWAALKWYIENVLAPVFGWLKDKITTAWGLIKVGIGAAWDFIKPILQAVIDFIKNKVQPIWDTLALIVVNAFNTIKNRISDIWGSITSSIKSGVNTAIDVINTLIDGLNKVSDILPGVDFHITHVQRLESGGRIGQHAPPAFATGTAHLPHGTVGGGFKTNGARAIVGEGRVGYPEFVIPTDPRYRNRAMGLTMALLRALSGRKAGLAAGPDALAIGGIIPSPGDVWNGIKGTGEKVADKAISVAYSPFSNIADRLIGDIPWKYAREMAKGMKSEVDKWVKGSDDALGLGNAAQAALVGNIKSKSGVNMNMNKDFLERYAAYNNEMGNPFTVVSGLRTYAQQVALYAAYLNGTGNLAAKPGTSRHESGYALDHAPGTNFATRYMDAAKKHGLHYPVRSPQAEDWHIEPIVRAMEGQILNMAKGGRFIARPQPGGQLVRVGEGGKAERVTVEPLTSLKKDGGGTTVNIYGNLEFPNITDADDAETLIDNLRDLSSD